jgi:hypothetical protein
LAQPALVPRNVVVPECDFEEAPVLGTVDHVAAAVAVGHTADAVEMHIDLERRKARRDLSGVVCDGRTKDVVEGSGSVSGMAVVDIVAGSEPEL